MVQVNSFSAFVVFFSSNQMRNQVTTYTHTHTHTLSHTHTHTHSHTSFHFIKFLMQKTLLNLTKTEKILLWKIVERWFEKMWYTCSNDYFQLLCLILSKEFINLFSKMTQDSLLRKRKDGSNDSRKQKSSKNSSPKTFDESLTSKIREIVEEETFDKKQNANSLRQKIKDKMTSPHSRLGVSFHSNCN
jgi:hypothetical protein